MSTTKHAKYHVILEFDVEAEQVEEARKVAERVRNRVEKMKQVGEGRIIDFAKANP